MTNIIRHFGRRFDRSTLYMPKVKILDGGSATQLEFYNVDLSGSLWSASALTNCPHLVERMHKDFIEAGADVIESCTYQVSSEGFRSQEKSAYAVNKGVEIAMNAIDGQQVALSFGPFAVSASDGSEYTGVYKSPYCLDKSIINVNRYINEHLVEFHLNRINALGSGATVDCILFETVPLLSEVRAIRKAMKLSKRSEPLWISLVFPDGSLPGSKLDSEGGQQSNKMVDILDSLFYEDDHLSDVTGIGINCTKPYYIKSLITELNSILKVSFDLNYKPSLSIYPDGGLVWDAVKRCWCEPDKNLHNDNSWSEELIDAISVVVEDDDSPFSIIIAGGCCKSGPEQIKQLRLACQKRNWLA